MPAGYGAIDSKEEEEVEMGGVTDEEDVKKRHKKGKKSGMKPGQALSFTGLEPRTHQGVDMLDMKQLLPRLVAGCFCMFCTIALVSWFAYSVLRNSAPDLQGQLDGTSKSSAQHPTVHHVTSHSKALQHIHHKLATAARGRHTSSAEAASKPAGRRRLLGALDLDAAPNLEFQIKNMALQR